MHVSALHVFLAGTCFPVPGHSSGRTGVQCSALAPVRRMFHKIWLSWLCLLVHSCSAVRAVIKRICRHKKRLFASTTDSSPILERFTVVTRDIFSCPVGFRRLVCPLIPFISSNFSGSIVNTRHNRSASCKAFCTHHKSTSVTESHFRLAATKRTAFQFDLTHFLPPPQSAHKHPAHSPRTSPRLRCKSAYRLSNTPAWS